jgi:tol-pal system protein YbgF
MFSSIIAGKINEDYSKSIMQIKSIATQIIALILAISPSTYVFANDKHDNAATSELESKRVSFEDEGNMLETLTKEVQALLSRIELLEHNISILQHKIDSMNVISTESSDNAAKRDVNISKAQGDKEIDVFADTTGEVTSNSPDSDNDVERDKKLYDLALASLKDNKLKEAEKKFDSFLENYPNSKLRGNAYFWYGEVFFKQKIYDKASINYLKGYKQFPKGPKASDSLLKLALSLGELDKKKEACNMIGKLEKEFPSRAASSVKRAKDAKIKFGCK